MCPGASAGAGAMAPRVWRDREDDMRVQQQPLTSSVRPGPGDTPRMPYQRDVPKPRLSDRERHVLMLYVSGLKLASVARRLDISPHTAKEYLDRVRGKYLAVGRPAPTKVDLHREAIRDGFVGH